MTEYNKYAVGLAVKRLRQERGLSQEVLSGLAGMARTHITMIESGTKQANFESLWKIACALSLPPHTLVEEIEKEAQALETQAKN